MKNEYRVQWMNREQYADYMGGNLFYTFQTNYVMAESAEEAKAIVKINCPEAIVNDKVITKAEEEAQEARYVEQAKKEEEKKAKAKARKIARDLANGITPEKRKALNNLRRHENEAERIAEEIENLKKALAEEYEIIARKKAKIAEM